MPALKPNRYVLRPSKAALRQQCRDHSHETPSEQKRRTTALREDRPRKDAHAQAHRRSQAQAGQRAERGIQKASNTSGQNKSRAMLSAHAKGQKLQKWQKLDPFSFITARALTKRSPRKRLSCGFYSEHALYETDAGRRPEAEALGLKR